MVGSSDLIGEAVLTLPDLGALIQSGTRRSEVPTRELRHPPATLTLTLILTLTLTLTLTLALTLTLTLTRSPSIASSTRART